METNNKPLVSVIMIVQNGERYIQEALQSIFNQHYHPIEVIAVHGQSTDGTAKILSSYTNIQIIQQKSTGISNAYNTGIKAANADFVSFLSYDDIWMPQKLSIQMKFMVQNPNILYSNHHISYFSKSNSALPNGTRKEWLTQTFPARIMETLVARKVVFEKVGYFDPLLSTAEDVDWYSRASDKQIPCQMLPDVLLQKRIHEKNASLQIEKNNQNLLAALREAVARKKQNTKSS